MMISREAWFVGGVSLTLGVLALVAAIQNKDCYYQLPKIQWIERRYGRMAARGFYAVLGVLMVSLAGFIWLRG